MRRLAQLLILALLACRPGAATSASRGEVAASWVGSATGAFRAPGTARWCARDTLLELFAVRNDTAIGFTLLPPDTLQTGAYPIFSTKVFAPSRPQSNAAARWLDQIELKGFEGSWGMVTLSETGSSGVSGTFEVALRRMDATDTLRLTGSFARVPVGKAIDACGRANRPGAG